MHCHAKTVLRLEWCPHVHTHLELAAHFPREGHNVIPATDLGQAKCEWSQVHRGRAQVLIRLLLLVTLVTLLLAAPVAPVVAAPVAPVVAAPVAPVVAAPHLELQPCTLHRREREGQGWVVTGAGWIVGYLRLEIESGDEGGALIVPARPACAGHHRSHYFLSAGMRMQSDISIRKNVIRVPATTTA